MTKINQKFTEAGLVILVWMIVGLGMVLRIHNGDNYPINQNDDGPFYVWVGNSILDNFKHPSSLTIFEADNPALFWRSQYRDLVPLEQFGFRLSESWFDHPFLATIFIALPARYFGFTGFSQIPQMLVRVPALITAIFTLFFTYKLATRVFGRFVGFLALIFLAVWPLAVFSQRQSYLENFITPVFLAGLGCLWKYRIIMARKGFLILSLCAFIASWTKLAGWTLFALFAYWLVYFKQKKWAISILVIGFMSVGLYLLYGQLVGGTQFWQTISNQGGRGTYLSSFFQILTTPQIYGVINDGWWFLGIVSMVYLLAKQDEASHYIGFSALVWWLCVFILSGPNNTSAWYRYPVYPLMAVASAVMIKDGYSKPSLWLIILLIILGLTGWSLAGVEVSSNVIRLGVLLLVGLYGILMFWKRNLLTRLNQVIVIGLVVVAVVGNILAINNLPRIRCGTHDCVHADKIILSTQ